MSISRCRDSIGAQDICGVIRQFLALSRGLSALIGSEETKALAIFDRYFHLLKLGNSPDCLVP